MSPGEGPRPALGLALAVHVAWLAALAVTVAAWIAAQDRGRQLFGRWPGYEEWASYAGTDPQLDRHAAVVGQLGPWVLASLPLLLLARRWLPAGGRVRAVVTGATLVALLLGGCCW